MTLRPPILPPWPFALPPEGQNANAPAGQERMRQSYELAGQLVRDHYARVAPENIRALERIRQTDIAVVRGSYDHIHRMLRGAGIPFTPVDPSALLSPGFEMAKVVFVNCGQSFPEEGAHRLADFVRSGGLLFTTDWALRRVLHVGFPGYLKHNGRLTENTVVVVEPKALSPGAERFFAQGTPPAWWLEDKSLPFQRQHRDVEVLIESSELRRRYGNGSVLARFPFGRGIVYHMISHLFLQQSEARDERHQLAAGTFAQEMFASERTMDSILEAERSFSGIDYGSLQAATSSVGMMSDLLADHWRKTGGFPEPPTRFQEPSEVGRMVEPAGGGPNAMSWYAPSGNFRWRPETGSVHFRMPAGRTRVTIGRKGDEVIQGDPTLSRRHATLARYYDPGSGTSACAIEAHSLVILHRNGDQIVVEPGKQAWLLAGDAIALTANVRFVFDGFSDG